MANTVTQKPTARSLRKAGLLALVIAIEILTPVFAVFQTAYADVATPNIAEAVVKVATLNTERNEIAFCLTPGLYSGKAVPVSVADVMQWNWFSAPTYKGMPLSDWLSPNPSSTPDCASLNGATLQSYFKDLGFTGTGIETACNVGFKRATMGANGTYAATKDCVTGNGSADNGSNEAFVYQSALATQPGTLGVAYSYNDAVNFLDKVYTTGYISNYIQNSYGTTGTLLNNQYDNVQYYVMAYTLFFAQSTCASTLINPVNSSTSATSGTKPADGSVWVVPPSGIPQQYWYSLNGSSTTAWNFRYNGASQSAVTDTCDSMGGTTNNNLVHIMELTYKDYANWVQNNRALAAKSVAPQVQNPGGGIPGDAKSTCTVAGVGWIVCPIANFLGSVADGSENLLQTFFLVDAQKLFSTSSPTYQAWQQMLQYANIIFIIAFIIIIFSQVTSFGVSNYGIKKLLPKLLVVALLVNISFYVCALAVDVSNLLGVSLANALANGITFQNSTSSSGLQVGSSVFTKVVSNVLIVGGGATLAAAYFSVATVVGILLALVVVAITMVILLAVRQGLILLLVVLSPLAFAAMLLPNTQSLYKKWLSMFKTLLFIFPIASVLYGAGKLAGNIIMHTSDSWLLQTMGAALPILMLVVVYKVFTSTMKGLEGIGGMIKGVTAGTDKLHGYGKNMLENSYVGQRDAYKKSEANKRRALIQSGQFSGSNKNPLNWARNGRKNVNAGLNRVSGKFGDRRTAQGDVLTQKMNQEEIDNQVQSFERKYSANPSNRLTNAQADLSEAIKSGDTVKARAAFRILSTSGGAGISKAREAIAGAQGSHKISDLSNEEQNVMNALKSDVNSAGVKSKDNVFASWAYQDKTMEEISKDTSTYDKLSDAEFATQSADNIKAAHTSGILTQARVDALRSGTSWTQMSEENRKYLNANFPVAPAQQQPAQQPPQTP